MASADTFPNPEHPFPKRGEPSWDLALMYPLQGAWSVEDYLALDSGLLVEYTDGFIRVLPMPSVLHQLIVQMLFRILDDFVTERKLGQVLLAPLPVRLTQHKYREPDIIYVRPERIATLKGHPDGADLAVEVVSEGRENRARDYDEKRREYAMSGISEYWIVDPQERIITVLTLSDHTYREHGVFRIGEVVTSVLLSGLRVSVSDIMSKCEANEGT